MFLVEEEQKKPQRSKFQRHVNILIWKCYLQRQRRWRTLLAQTVFASVLLIIIVFVAKPVFLTPLQAEPEAPLTSADLLASLHSNNILGYAPTNAPFVDIMSRAAELLQTELMAAATEEDLNNILYNRSMGTPLKSSVIWVLWKPKKDTIWKFSIRSTERARYATASQASGHPNPHLRAGFLAVQTAISQAIIEHVNVHNHTFEVSLVSMPVSPLMQVTLVRRAISGILLCLTMALIPPVLETQAFVVTETVNKFKRSMRIRDVDFSAMYIAWLFYAYMTAAPICLLAAFTLILIFRWIHLLFALLIVVAYVSVMIMVALIMAMFHSKASIACLWSVLFTFLETFLAQMLVYHEYDLQHEALNFLLHLALPPLGLVHALNEFAMLQTGRGTSQSSKPSLLYTILSWSGMNVLYFAILMILQRTMKERAIGGPVSWKSIIFKKVEDKSKLRPIKTPTGKEREKLQEVDDLLAKAICFRNVSKRIMNVPILTNITMDLYRGEFSMIYAKRIEERLIITLEDLITGMTFPDEGTITVLGQPLTPHSKLMSTPYMMGYCHDQKFLVDDLTVEEHLLLFTEICLWNESRQYMSEYFHIRSHRLLAECDLESVSRIQVQYLGTYYKAQLCWAIALLMEPRIIFIPNFMDIPSYVTVIKDKIMHYKKYLTIVTMCYTSIQLECADRVFIVDNKEVVFGGTPAYMFFKFGREYRFRMTFRGSISNKSEVTSELLERATGAGATVRAHLGSLLILRVPTTPTAKVAELVKHLTENASKYGIISMSISLPDTEEVSNRAITESRCDSHETSEAANISKLALNKITESQNWRREHTTGLNFTHVKQSGWKFISFYLSYKPFIIITIVASIVSGVFIGISLSSTLAHVGKVRESIKLLHGEVLTVEYLEQKTTLVIRSDKTDVANSIAKAYVMSETGSTNREIQDIAYTALTNSESLTEYLVTRAIDSPQQYVFLYAYGMDVSTNSNNITIAQALYSPLHHDQGAAARSLARVYMALIRYYSKTLNASIQVIDDPLALDLTPWMKLAERPPLLIQFLLILTISHITLIPSMEHGLVRHLQCHAANSSPVRYWLSLYVWDLILYCILVAIMSLVTMWIVRLTLPLVIFSYIDIAIIPVMLFAYGFGCIPQAYLFSIGPRAPLNSMTYIIASVVFGESTVVAKFLYGNALNYALYFMRLSPQFNMAYAYVKIKQIFVYNSECILFERKKLCSSKMLHKCCEKCGVLQECFSYKNYFTTQPGILVEVFAMIGTAAIFTTILMLWEYKVVQMAWRVAVLKWTHIKQQTAANESVGFMREKADVVDKLAALQSKRREKVDTFGEYLLLDNVSKEEAGFYILKNIYFGIGKGEVLALSGLKRHGRQRLCDILAGYKVPTSGQIWSMSKWKLKTDPSKYTRNVSISCDRSPLPGWMKVRDALAMLAVLRGVPGKHLNQEIQTFLEALELKDQADVKVRDLVCNEVKRLHFAAAVVGAPAVLIVDEFTANQKEYIRRAMYYILYTLKKRGHGIFISASSVEPHMPLTNRLAILVDGHIFDIDCVDRLVGRYSEEGYTVVVHLKDEAPVHEMFAHYFNDFIINDISDVLVNVQVLDDLNWDKIFEKMEALQEQNRQVYSYIISAIPIDYIYNSIITNEHGLKPATDYISWFCLQRFFTPKKMLKTPGPKVINGLTPFEKNYDITKLKALPWSVIFQR